MARYIPNIIKNLLTQVPSGIPGDILQFDPNKPERNKILLSRNTGPFPRADINGGPIAYEYENSIYSHIEGVKRLFRPNPVFTDAYTFEQANKREPRDGKIQQDFIAIVDIDSEPFKYIKLPFVPRELQYNPQSNFVGIASFGRNNPYYQFMGSEDIVTFEIDWYSNEKHREDVLYNCRWLEALTKGDGYGSRPHRCMIIWGAGMNTAGSGQAYNDGAGDKMFGEKSKWLLTAAPYKLSEFNRGYIDKESGEFVNTHMLPQQAIQQVTFKRLAETNRTHLDILGDLEPTSKTWTREESWETEETELPGEIITP